MNRAWFLGELRETTKRHFSTSFDTLCQHLDTNGDGKVDRVEEVRGLLFGDFQIADADPRLYDELLDMDQLGSVMDTYLEDYNHLTTKPMDLVMFRFAIEHCSRIARILSLPGGNALLVGVGGSGRQSLTRLAAFMGEFELFQIEAGKAYGPDEFREDVRTVLRQAGVDGTPTVFLVADTQITHEEFVEDISNMLNAGAPPNIYPADEKATLVENMRAVAKSIEMKSGGHGGSTASENMSPEDLYSLFLERASANLHIILAFSPVGDVFRQRLRKFPSLVNCCTIDWFSMWPQDGLVAVAEKGLQDVNMADDIRSACVEMCMTMHKYTQDLRTRFYRELQRHYYVTPTSYLEVSLKYSYLPLSSSSYNPRPTTNITTLHPRPTLSSSPPSKT